MVSVYVLVVYRLFKELAESLPEPQRSNAGFCKELDETDDTESEITQRDFILVRRSILVTIDLYICLCAVL